MARVHLVPAGVTMFLGAVVPILTTPPLPRRLGGLAAATAVLLLISLTGVSQTPEGGVVGIAGFDGFLLFLVWVLGASVVPLPARPAAAGA